MKSLTYIKIIDNLPVVPRWKGERGGKEVLYRRVAAGVALPKPDQPAGAVIVLGERYAEEGPPVFEALGAKVGLWMDIEKALRAFRRLFKVQTFVVEPDELAADVLRHTDLRDAVGGIGCAILQAPAPAITEIGRQQVDRLAHEKRLTLAPVKATLDAAAEPAALALQCAVGWLMKYPARYGGREDVREQNRRRSLSYAGKRRGPDAPLPIRPGMGFPMLPGSGHGKAEAVARSKRVGRSYGGNPFRRREG